ncbi:MAG TPA: glycosyltransferase family 1 protein [Candidatus Acidoferrales bacterium]|nr:glycosyltransferase family 1 protein [Candidatus Acidoferrales bacterium]
MEPYGGISRYFVELASALRSQGVDSRIVAGVHINKYIHNEGTIGLRLPNVRGLRRLARPCNDVLGACYSRWVHPDILHKTYYGDHRWQPKSSVVITIHDMIWERLEGVAHPLSRAKASWIERADAVVAISEFTRTELLEIYRVPESKVKVIHLASRNFPDRSAIVAPPKDSYLLYVGVRIWYKNFDRFVKAYSASRILKQDFRVVCFGKEFSDQERRLFVELGVQERIVQVQGDDSTLAAYYRNARALVCPSLVEGFGLPVLEAMKCGCPVICSGMASLPEVAGDAAVYFDAGDEESIRVILESALFDDERLKTMVEVGKARALGFSWEKCASETLGVYQAICGS